jgi:hypothetical protein
MRRGKAVLIVKWRVIQQSGREEGCKIEKASCMTGGDVHGTAWGEDNRRKARGGEKTK